MNQEEKKNGGEVGELREKLRSALPPMGDAELRRDLWPQMLRKMQGAPVPNWTSRVPWFDWTLLAISGAALMFFPVLIPALLYQL